MFENFTGFVMTHKEWVFYWIPLMISMTHNIRVIGMGIYYDMNPGKHFDMNRWVKKPETYGDVLMAAVLPFVPVLNIIHALWIVIVYGVNVIQWLLSFMDKPIIAKKEQK